MATGVPSRLSTRVAMFERSFRAHYPYVEAFVRSRRIDDVDDVVAETFQVAWRRFDDCPDGFERAWLFGIARNVARNHDRSARRRRARVDAVASTRPMSQSRLNPDGVPIEYRDALNTAFTRLSSTDQEILRLAAWDGLRGGELGVALGVKPEQANVRLSRARSRLRALFEEVLDERAP